MEKTDFLLVQIGSILVAENDQELEKTDFGEEGRDFPGERGLRIINNKPIDLGAKQRPLNEAVDTQHHNLEEQLMFRQSKSQNSFQRENKRPDSTGNFPQDCRIKKNKVSPCGIEEITIQKRRPCVDSGSPRTDSGKSTEAFMPEIVWKPPQNEQKRTGSSA